MPDLSPNAYGDAFKFHAKTHFGEMHLQILDLITQIEVARQENALVRGELEARTTEAQALTDELRHLAEELAATQAQRDAAIAAKEKPNGHRRRPTR